MFCNVQCPPINCFPDETVTPVRPRRTVFLVIYLSASLSSLGVSWEIRGKAAVNDVPSNFEFLAAQMADPRTNCDADEPPTLSRSDVALAAITGRGGIRIEPGNGV